jgi:hypothetical protein
MRIFRDPFQYLFQGRRKKSEFFESSVELNELLPIRQFTLEQKKGDFLKGGLLGKVFDAITAVGQADASLTNGADSGRTGGLPTQTAC